MQIFCEVLLSARTKMKKQKHKIILEVLHEVSVEVPETKQFIGEHLEQKCLKENMWVEEVVYIFLQVQ